MSKCTYFGCYRMLFWTAVDNGVLAVVEAMLFLVASRHTTVNWN